MIYRLGALSYTALGIAVAGDLEDLGVVCRPEMAPVLIQEVADILNVKAYLDRMALAVLLGNIEILEDTDVELMSPRCHETVSLSILSLARTQILAVVDIVPEIFCLLVCSVDDVGTVYYIILEGKFILAAGT